MVDPHTCIEGEGRYQTVECRQQIVGDRQEIVDRQQTLDIRQQIVDNRQEIVDKRQQIVDNKHSFEMLDQYIVLQLRNILYDTPQGQVGFSGNERNPALLVRDELRTILYGKSLGCRVVNESLGEIPWPKPWGLRLQLGDMYQRRNRWVNIQYSEKDHTTD